MGKKKIMDIGKVRVKKLETRVTLFVLIEGKNLKALRFICEKEKKEMATVIKEAVESHIKKKSEEYPIFVISSNSKRKKERKLD